MRKKGIVLFISLSLCVSALAGCGEGADESKNSSEVEESLEGMAEDSSEEASGGQDGSASAEGSYSIDPLEMISEGYYSYTYPLDGGEDMCAFFHFYEEQPVLGSVFYAGFAWNQVSFAGTYTVEEKESNYSCIANRDDQTAEPIVYTEGTAPYTVTFYDFTGEELGSCGFDGDVLYNDTEVSGIGAEQCMFYHDVDAASKYMSTYEEEANVAYLDFVAEDPTSTLTLYHNGRYQDMVDMLVEGSWTMTEGADGYECTLTPDYESDTGAVATVAADKQSCIYTPEGGEAVSMTNAKSAEPKVTMQMTGETVILGQETKADMVGKLYDDGTVTLTVSAFGTEMEIDNGTWVMGENGYTITFTFTYAGELVSGLGDAGAVLQYVGTNEVLGDIDTELVISIVG